MYNMPSDYYFPFLSKSSSYIHVFINFYIIDVLYVCMCGHMHSPMCVEVRRQFEGLCSLSTTGVPGFSSGLYLLRYLSGLFIFIFYDIY